MVWVVALLLISPAALAGKLVDPPPPLSLTAEEEAELADREVVVRLVDTESGGDTTAIIDCDAPVEEVFAAVIDLPPRAAEVGSIESLSIYSRTPATTSEREKLGARYHLRVFGRDVIWSTIYELDREQAWTAYDLDPAKEHDIEVAYGSYQAYAVDDGTRLVYRSYSESGTAVPQWLKRWLAGGSLTEQLEGIRARAEAD